MRYPFFWSALAGLLALTPACKNNNVEPDAGEPDAEVLPDMGPPVEGPVTKKNVGEPCEADKDCLTNVCYAKVCQKTCSGPAACAASEDCGSDNTAHPAFCYSRSYSADIGKSCALTGTCPTGMKCLGGGADSATAYCTAECKDSTACPPTFTCQELADSTAPGGKRNFCVRRGFCGRCAHDGQCENGGKCIKQGTASFCTLPCTQGSTECPRFADCKDVGGGDFQCVHRAGTCAGSGEMCQPCLDEPDCKEGALCLTFTFSKESFCATACPTPKQSCEGSDSYQCQEIQTGLTTKSNQCVPYNPDPKKEISCIKLSPTMEVGAILPDFAMVGYADENRDGSLAGETLKVVKLSDFTAAKIILFNVSAGWCGPCQQETKMMADLMATYARDGLAIFQVLYDGKDPGTRPTRAFLDAWVAALNPQGACGIDPNRDVAPYNTNGTTPLNMILDPKTRKVIAKWNGIAAPGLGTLEASIKHYLELP